MHQTVLTLATAIHCVSSNEQFDYLVCRRSGHFEQDEELFLVLVDKVAIVVLMSQKNQSASRV